ncbi:MAG TPA: hypothetical protein VFB38_14250 [Chthonomonadaceae bacterium]|nr:hypothetical protein [Chthonomonadaceae bacterium]
MLLMLVLIPARRFASAPLWSFCAWVADDQPSDRAIIRCMMV